MDIESTERAAPPTRSWSFTALGTVALFAVAVGFGRTYFAPVVRGTFQAPTAVHIHGALALSWVVLFFVQPLLVRWRLLKWHRRLGKVGLPLAIGVALTMIPAGMFQVGRDVAMGAGATGISAFLGVVTSGALFVTLVTLGIVKRKDREAHSRWMLLATLVVIWPAWFRFRHWFPPVSRPDILFGLVLADLWIFVAMVRDRFARGTIHPVLFWGGIAIMCEQTFEVFAFDSSWWRAAAQWVYDAAIAVGL